MRDLDLTPTPPPTPPPTPWSARYSGVPRRVRVVMARRRRGVGLFDVVMLLILAAAAWFVLGQAGIVPPLPIGR